LINKWGTLFLIVMTLPIMGHVVILPLMLDVAGRDGWISIFLAVPFGLLFAFAVYRLRLKHPAPDFMAAFGAHAGKPAVILLRLLLAAYLFFLSAFTLAALADMIHIAYLPATPIWILIAWFMLCCLYAACKGVRAISLTAGVLALVALFTGHSVTAMATPKKELTNLLPVFEFGYSPSLWGILVLCSIWIELLFLLLIPIDMKEKRLFLFWAAGVLLNALMMLSTLTGALMIFGMGQADQFMFPALQTVRIISLGFIDRFDIYAMLLMSLGSYIRISLFLRLGCQLVAPAKVLDRRLGKLLILAVGVGVTLAAVFMAQNHLRMVHMVAFYALLVCLYPLPFVLLMFPNRKRKQGAKAVMAGP
jgi:spore germination protein (amino acid permease)